MAPLLFVGVVGAWISLGLLAWYVAENGPEDGFRGELGPLFCVVMMPFALLFVSMEYGKRWLCAFDAYLTKKLSGFDK